MKEKVAESKIGSAVMRLIRMTVILITIIVICEMFIQVVARYFFKVSISGLDELSGHTAVWLYFLGSAIASYDKSHIKVDIIQVLLKNNAIKHFLGIIAEMVTLAVNCFFFLLSLKYADWSIAKNEVTPTLQIPTIVFQSSLVVGLALMTIYSMIKLKNQLFEKSEVS